MWVLYVFMAWNTGSNVVKLPTQDHAACETSRLELSHSNSSILATCVFESLGARGAVLVHGSQAAIVSAPKP